MDPITIVMASVLGLLVGVGGFVIGRKTSPARVEYLPALPNVAEVPLLEPRPSDGPAYRANQMVAVPEPEKDESWLARRRRKKEELSARRAAEVEYYSLMEERYARCVSLLQVKQAEKKRRDFAELIDVQFLMLKLESADDNIVGVFSDRDTDSDIHELEVYLLNIPAHKKDFLGDPTGDYFRKDIEYALKILGQRELFVASIVKVVIDKVDYWLSNRYYTSDLKKAADKYLEAALEKYPNILDDIQ